MQTIREKVISVVLPAAAGPAIQQVDLALADQSGASIRGWQGNSAVTAPNAWIFTGKLSLVECQARIAGSGDARVDGVCLSDSAATEWQIDEDTHAVTVFWEIANTSGQSAPVTLIVREFTRDRDSLG